MLKNSNLTNIITFKDVSKIFGSQSVGIQNLNLTISKGEFVCIVGASGSGKSTILDLIAGMEAPSSGQMVIPPKVAMVFQSGALLPWLSVLENVEIVLAQDNKNSEENKKTATKYLDMMGLHDFINKCPHELSGGQRQRVGIARALSVDTEVLLLDEPFSALDPQTASELHNDILNIWQQTNKTIIMVSHLIEEAVTLASRVILVKNHTVEHIFPISLQRPRQEQALEFMNEVNKIKKDLFSK